MKKISISLPLGKYYAPLLAVIAALVSSVLLTATASMQNETKTNAEIISATVQDKDKQAPVKEKASDSPGDASPSPSPNLVTATTYPFTSSTGVALEDMSSGTTQLVAANLDDNASAVTNIGFDYWYDGVRFTQFSVNANGLCRLGATAVSTAFDNSTGFNSTTDAPKIAPYYDDLWTGTNGKVHFKVIGSAPARKLIVEWQNEQIPRVAAGNTGAGTFQMWLFETTGVIEFVYGTGVVLNSTNGGYSIGLQSGAATNFASVTTSTSTVSYAAANNTQTNAITSGTKYTFTPNVPAAPTGLSFTSVTQTSMTLNWTDNATNEVGYAIYNSTDGTNFTFVTQTAANATSQAVAGLSPGINYSWQVFAVTEGALSTVLTGSQATVAAGMVVSTAAGGNWSAPATWVGGTVPTSTDNVTIVDGATVTIDIAANALNLTVGQGASGILQYEATTARTLTVVQGVTIASNGTFQSATTGTQTGHVLSIGTNLTNNGTLDFSTNANTAGAGITFTGAANATFSGTGATTDIRAMTINKGTSSASVLELMTSAFTVQGVTTDVAGFLTLTNGTLKISGAFSGTNRVFTVAAYTIPATGGFWINNLNYTVAGQNGSPTTSGLLRISQGTFNIGTASGNSMGFAAGSTIIVEGGAVNATGRFGVAAAGNAVTYNQSAGTITVCTVGNASTTLASFDLGTPTGSSVTMTGGTIVVQLANTGGSGPRDYRHQAGLTGTTTVTGGTLQLGNAASGAAKAFSIAGVVPNLVINNASAGHSATFLAPVAFNNITRNITINTGNTLNIGNNVFLMNGATLTNNGTLTANGASSNFVWFLTTAPQSYTGSGTVTAPVTNFAVQADLGLTIDPSSPNIVVGAVRLFSGSITNSNKITLGNGGATSGIVQIGNTTTPTAAGTFDVPLTFNLGTGGEIISYLRTTTSRTTGGEVNPTRSITTFTYDDNDATHTLTIAGGDLTVTGTASLTNGRIVTGTNALAIGSAGTVARTTGYVDGNLRKTYAAAASKSFEVGTANGFSPVTVNVTAGTLPADFTVKAVQGPQPNIVSPQGALQRYWTLTATGVTADLTFNYLDPPDVPPTITESTLVIFKYDGTFTMPGGTVNTAANTATITGVTSFSDWTLAGPNAPTDINLISFAAENFASNAKSPKSGSTLLRWQTGYEVANLGFNIYRDENGSRVRVTPDLVAGSALFVGTRTALGAGRSYTWRDAQGQPGPDAQYWLEEVDLRGQSIWHGPVKAVSATGIKQLTAYDEPNSALIGELGAGASQQDTTAPVEPKAKPGKLTPLRIEAQASLTEQPAVKLAVKQEGWYRVSQPELVAVGFDPNVDSRFLQLFVDGQEQPIAVIAQREGLFDSSAAIEFYGMGMNTASTDTRVYWLVAGTQPGKRIQQIKSQGGPQASGGFSYAAERRDRTVYFSSLLNGEKENFFGAVIARDPVGQSLTLQHLYQSTGGQADLEVALQGVSEVAHRVKVQINGTDAGELLFSGQAQGVARFSIQQSLLKEGQNQVRLTAQAGPGDVSLVDYVRLTYQHTYTADNNLLRLTATGRQQVTIDGFSNNQIQVVDITNPSAVQEVTGVVQQQKSGYAITFTAPDINSRTLLAFASDQKRAAGLALNRASKLRQTANGADLLIITRRDFLGSLESLKSWRQKQGLSVAMVDIEDVYDEFSFGQKSPQALKDFLSYARSSWKKAPRFALLAADASYDAKNYLGFGDSDFVPTKLIDTQFMETASDSWLADFDGDGVEDMAIGRLPARTAQEASGMAAKIISYDQSSPSETLLLVSDKNDVYDFEGASAQLRALIPASVRVVSLDRSALDDATARIRLLELISRGQKIVNYTGHGSVTLWRGNILASEDVNGLSNNQNLSLFVTMTCLNGYFADPALDSLAESLMKAEGGGAVAVWASSGMTLPGAQAAMNQEVYRQLFAAGSPGLTLGQAMARAKAAINDGDIRRTWILFGDPTARLK